MYTNEMQFYLEKKTNVTMRFYLFGSQSNFQVHKHYSLILRILAYFL